MNNNKKKVDTSDILINIGLGLMEIIKPMWVLFHPNIEKKVTIGVKTFLIEYPLIICIFIYPKYKNFLINW